MNDSTTSSGLKIIDQDNYEVAYNEAQDILSKSSPIEICARSGAELLEENGRKKIKLSFLNDSLIITHPDISVSYLDKDNKVSMWLKILVLHYLIYSKGTPETGEQITFKQLEGGLGYYPAFQKRTIAPILENFPDLGDFIKAGELIGGMRSGQGDFSVTFTVFPRMTATYIFWNGDEDFPAEGSVVFDSSFKDYLTTEDIVVMCNMISIMMIKKKYSGLI